MNGVAFHQADIGDGSQRQVVDGKGFLYQRISIAEETGPDIVDEKYKIAANILDHFDRKGFQAAKYFVSRALAYFVGFRKEIEVNGLPVTDLERKGGPAGQVKMMTERLPADIEQHLAHFWRNRMPERGI